MRRLSIILLTSVVAVSCLGQRPKIKHPEVPQEFTTLTLVGQFSIRALTRFPPVIGLPFGGISGLTTRNAGTEIYGISDAQQGGRIYRFALEGLGGSLRVDTLSVVSLAMAPGDNRPDHEGIVLLPDGTFAVSAEGTGREPRLPPSINIYGRHGDFVSRLSVPDKFVPEPTGPATRGARGNAGFESLTLSPDGDRLFTAAETALIQDGDVATFEAGARDPNSRIRRAPRDVRAGAGVRLRPRAGAEAADHATLLHQRPGRTAGGQPHDASGARTRICREHGESGAEPQSHSAVQNQPDRRDRRIPARVAQGASRRSSPVTKTLLMDLSEIQGLSRELAPSLDNFEGMAFGPRLPDGRASLIIVSDDNFSEAQRTWFLLFAIQ